jgi:predicted O-methyltransferase YrrM
MFVSIGFLFMTFDDIVHHLQQIPHIPPERGKLLYDFILETRPARILELGFAHGTSTCYMAAALQANGAGSILTIDNLNSRHRDPSITTLMQRTGLAPFITPVFAQRSYTWELMKLLESQTTAGRTEPCFDFVFIDGGHTWDSDGFAFLLVDRLLKPGGHVLFDDVTWTPSVCAGEDWVDALPEEERDVAHVEKVFQLLVVPDQKYTGFEFDGVWAWAQKKTDNTVEEDRSAVVAALYAKSNAARRSFLIRRYVKRLFRIS